VAALTAAVVRLENHRRTNIIGSCTEFIRCLVGWVNGKHDQTSIRIGTAIWSQCQCVVCVAERVGSRPVQFRKKTRAPRLVERAAWPTVALTASPRSTWRVSEQHLLRRSLPPPRRRLRGLQRPSRYHPVAFSTQDTAIRPSNAEASGHSEKCPIAFASRQFAILDVSDVRIGQLAGGTVTSTQEMPKINCISSMVLYGSVGYVAQAGGISTLSLNCAFSFESTPQVNAIAVATKKSLILASQASWSELSLVKSISAPTARLTGPRPCQELRFLVGKLSRQMTGRWETGRCACRPFSLVRRSTRGMPQILLK
jgi:hypothetical protein